MGDVRESQERKRERDQDCKRDKVLVEGETDIVGYTPSGEVRLTGPMRKDRTGRTNECRNCKNT